MKPARWFLLALLFVMLIAVPASAQDGGEGPTDDEVNAIAKKLYCPVCENVPLDVCPTQACTQWRQIIREKLGEGWAEGQIIQYFANQYGDRVLATPPTSGLNWLIYILPPAALVFGAAVLVRAFRNWRTPSDQPREVIRQDSDDPYVAMVEEELRRRSA